MDLQDIFNISIALSVGSLILVVFLQQRILASYRKANHTVIKTIVDNIKRIDKQLEDLEPKP